ncbi:FIST C-terminal domain-containing protein [Candidatus Woesearchaeota archaeon]|nr:FIST C-terminal domain-containing protein [Candidatus Woesearchaeota archaeon]
MGLDLNIGVGASILTDSYEAGVEAAEKAIEKLGGEKPDVAILFAAPKFQQEKMLDGVKSVVKNTPMIGGTTAGEISTSGLSVNSVVLMVIKSKDVKFYTGIGKNVSKSEIKAGKQLAEGLLKKTNLKNANTLVMLPDGLAGDGLAIIEGAKKVLGENFEIIGGALGDEANFKHTCQYYNGKVYENVVVGMLICGGGKIKTASGVRHGWDSVGNRFKCTKAKGNVVYDFGGKKALDFYTELLGKERGKKLPAIGLEYPMGLIDDRAKIEGHDYFQIRCPLKVNKKDGSVTFAASIPQGKEVTLTYSTRAAIINGSYLSAVQAKKTLKGKARLIMMFSCVARKMVLGRRTNDEIEVVKRVFGKNVPIIGFYTYGEIGPIDKRVPTLRSARWHNETVVIWVVGE